MQLEGADDSSGGAFLPARLASVIPLASQLLEGVGCGQRLGGLALTFGHHRALAAGGLGFQLRSLGAAAAPVTAG